MCELVSSVSFITMAAGSSARWQAILIWCLFLISFFLLPNLRGCLALCHQTLQHVRWWVRFINVSQKFGGPPPKNWQSKDVEIHSNNFATSLRISPESNKISSVGAAISPSHYAFMCFGLQRTKIRTRVHTQQSSLCSAVISAKISQKLENDIVNDRINSFCMRSGRNHEI